jgi:hypothetical protein
MIPVIIGPVRETAENLAIQRWATGQRLDGDVCG